MSSRIWHACVAAGVVPLLSMLVACESTSEADGGRDAAAVDSGSIVDAGPACADGNDTPATASNAGLDVTAGVMDSIACPGDVDFFAFDGTEGDFVRLFVRPEGTFMGRRLDPVLTLFDDAGNELAENDDGIEGLGPIGNHPLLVTRLPATGRYVVRVDEFEHWSEMSDGIGDPALTYALHVQSIDAESEDAVEDPETGDDAASATALRFLPRTLGMPVDFGYAVGTFEDDTDVDVYSFEITGATDTVAFGVTLQPAGPDGGGSTMRAGHLWVTDGAGTVVIAQTDTSMESGLSRVAPTLANGSYLLFVDRSNEPAESNDFYALSVTRSPNDNPREMDESGNGTLAGAEPLAFETFGDGQAAFFLAFLTPSDVDYFSFAIPAGFVLNDFGCSSAWEGSGIRGLRGELRDSSDAVLAAEVEDDVLPMQLFLDATDFGAVGEGTYAARLSMSAQDATVTGNWVRCGVRLGPAT